MMEAGLHTEAAYDMLSSLLSAISIGEKIVLIIANLREICRDKNSLIMKVIICYIEVYEDRTQKYSSWVSASYK